MNRASLIALLLGMAVGAWLIFPLPPRGCPLPRPWHGSARQDAAEMISWHLRLERPRDLTEEQLRECVERELGLEVGPISGQAVIRSALPGELPGTEESSHRFVIELPRHRVAVLQTFAAARSRPGRAKASDEHPTGEGAPRREAYLTISSAIWTGDDEAYEEACRITSRLAAGLAEADCSVVSSPELDVVREVDSQMLEMLRSEDPLALFLERDVEPRWRIR